MIPRRRQLASADVQAATARVGRDFRMSSILIIIKSKEDPLDYYQVVYSNKSKCGRWTYLIRVEAVASRGWK